jgi:hypothetical protein
LIKNFFSSFFIVFIAMVEKKRGRITQSQPHTSTIVLNKTFEQIMLITTVHAIGFYSVLLYFPGANFKELETKYVFNTYLRILYVF